MKVVINKCYGGFGISPLCLWELVQRNAKCVETIPLKEWATIDIEDDLGANANLPSNIKTYFFGAPLVDMDTRTVYCLNKSSARQDLDLIELIETKGSDWCSGELAELVVVEIPDGIEWEIEEYDGVEWVSEAHRTWG